MFVTRHLLTTLLPTTLLMLGASLRLAAQPPARTRFITPAFAVRVTRDIRYATMPVRSAASPAKALLLDLYEPVGDSTPGLRPIFVAVHGGAWQVGSRNSPDAVDLCRELASRGYVCASIDYRLAKDSAVARGKTESEKTHSAAIDDAEFALRWVAANARTYRVDTTRVALGGSSAGAITSLRVGYDRRNPLVRAVLSWSGGLQGDERLIAADGPALMVIHGAEDESVPVSEARALVARARRVRVPVTAFICAGVGHIAPLDRRPLAVSLHEHIARFLFASLDLAALAGVPPPPVVQHSETAALPCPR